MRKELIKELKDNDFPKENPTLEELIEACGDNLLSLEVWSGDGESWGCTYFLNEEGDVNELEDFDFERADTPIDSVAVAWLEIKKRTTKLQFRDDFTLQEFAGIVDKSIKTISRRIAMGKINPRIIKSKQGTTEYRFSDDNIKAFFYDELPTSVKNRL